MVSVTSYVKRARSAHLKQFQELLRIPSVSTDSRHAKDVRRAAEWVCRRLKSVGCTKAKIYKTARHPVVYGEWLGAPNAPTALVYGHYDVQPVDPVELWSTPPFDPVVRNGKIFARGASDNKGQFLAHVLALEAHLQSHGSCPVNVKFLIEGEEEIGSPNLDAFIAKQRSLLACDVAVVSDSAMFAKGQPAICYGLRGLAYLEVRIQGTDRDLHSGSYGGAVINPANALVRLLASLKDDKGRVTVPGFYEKVQRLSSSERRAFAALPHSDTRFKRAIGAPELFGEAGYTTLERIWGRPTLDINGIWGGFTGEGAKTVIPAVAQAKISMRLVPDQTPQEVARKVRAFFKKTAPRSVRVSVNEHHGGAAWLTPTDQPAIRAAGRALERAFGRKPVMVREGGSIPIVANLDRLLKVPTVLMGLGLNDDNLHAPDEKMELDNFYRGIAAAAFLMEELATASRNGRPFRRPRAKGR